MACAKALRQKHGMSRKAAKASMDRPSEQGSAVPVAEADVRELPGP